MYYIMDKRPHKIFLIALSKEPVYRCPQFVVVLFNYSNYIYLLGPTDSLITVPISGVSFQWGYAVL